MTVRIRKVFNKCQKTPYLLVLIKSCQFFLFCAVVLSSWAAMSAAAHGQFTRLTSADGLTQNTVSAILQDRLGYIWLATGDGLVKYDGYETIPYRHNPDILDSLGDNYLLSLIEDGDGMVWVGTAGAGLDRLDPQNGTVRHYRHVAEDPLSLPDNKDVRVLAIDGAGALWVGTANGLARRPAGADYFEPVALTIPETSDGEALKILAIHVGRSGTIYVSTAHHGVYLHHGAAQALSKPIFAKLSLDPMTVTALYEDEAGGLWLGTESNGLLYLADTPLASDHLSPRTIPLPDKEVTAILPGSEGQLWVGSWNAGLIALNPTTGQTMVYHNSLADPRSISSNAVISLMRDRSGMVWAGTYDRGVNRFVPNAAISHYYRDPLEEASLPDNTVWAFAEAADGTVWTGTAGGLGLFSPSEGRFIPFAAPDGAEGLETKTDVRALALTNDSLWIGTWGKGLLRWQAESGTVTQYLSQPDMPDSLSHNRVRLILADRDGTLWVGTQGGLNQFSPQSARFIHHRHNTADPGTLPNDRIRALHLDHNGTLWVGTSGGLSRRNPDGSFTNWSMGNSRPGTLQDDDIRDIYEATDGSFWLATGHGLTHFDAVEGPQHTFDERDGFRNATLYGVLPDKMGRLWISTNFGLTRFDTTTNSIQTYTADQGLQDNEFNFGAYGTLRTGMMLFGGINGFNLFDPAQASVDPPPEAAPTLALKHLVVRTAQGAERTERPAENQPIHLSHRDRLVSVSLAALQYDRPLATRFSMWLEGRDAEWSAFRTDLRQISLSNLAPGSYRLRVKAKAANGLLSRNEIVLPLIVSPAPWQTVWAYAAYIALGLAAVAALHLARTRMMAHDAARLRREVDRQTVELQRKAAEIAAKNAELQDLLSFRSTLYRTLSHELRNPLAVVQSGLQILASAPSGTAGEAATTCLSSCYRLSGMVDKLLLLAKTDQQPPVDPVGHSANIAKTLQPLLPEFSLLADARSVAFTAETEAENWVHASAEALELIARNLVANALHHTPAGGRVHLQTSATATVALIIVTDTGTGIAPEHHGAIFDEFFRILPQESGNPAGAGLGLALVRELVEHHGGTVSVDSQLGQGARFTAALPRAATPDFSSPPVVVPAEVVLGAAVASERAAAAPRPEGTLVIVEDDPELAEWLPSLFADDFISHIVTSVDAALVAIHMEMPDAILCDVMLHTNPHDRSGFELVEAIRQDMVIGHIPILLLTALNDDENRLTGLSLGVDDYITKPFDNNELRARLRNIIANRRQVREYLRRSLTNTEHPTSAATRLSLGDGLPAELHLGETSRQFLAQLEQCVRNAIADDQASLPMVAAALGISDRQLQRRLRDICDLSFSELRTAIRMRDAQRLLATTKPITEIAHELGFTSAAYFAQVFKRVHKMTPSDWRRKLLSQ
jgi:signal transduction histidine kinase/ligand-binding sensor domain-containing protein/DNA-binding response OmpR family regulator